jgi:hypothetical protein
VSVEIAFYDIPNELEYETQTQAMACLFYDGKSALMWRSVYAGLLPFQHNLCDSFVSPNAPPTGKSQKTTT